MPATSLLRPNWGLYKRVVCVDGSVRHKCGLLPIAYLVFEKFKPGDAMAYGHLRCGINRMDAHFILCVFKRFWVCGFFVHRWFVQMWKILNERR